MIRTALTVMTAALASVGAQQQSPAFESESTPQAICQPMDFQDHQSIYNRVNEAIDLSNRLSKWVLSFKDPLAMPTKTLDPLPFTVLFSDFEIKPTIQMASVAGFSNMQVHHVNAIDHTVLSAGVGFANELRLKATVNLHIAQKNRSWFTPCWTDPWHPVQCNAMDTTLEIDFGVVEASGDVIVLAEILECAKNMPATTCSDVTTGDLIKSVITMKLDRLISRFWLRMQRLEILSVTPSFTKVTAMKAELTTQSWLLNKLQEKISSFSLEELNKHGAVYTTFMSFAGQTVKSLVNFIIEHTVATRFGKTCLDRN